MTDYREQYESEMWDDAARSAAPAAKDPDSRDYAGELERRESLPHRNGKATVTSREPLPHRESWQERHYEVDMTATESAPLIGDGRDDDDDELPTLVFDSLVVGQTYSTESLADLFGVPAETLESARIIALNADGSYEAYGNGEEFVR